MAWAQDISATGGTILDYWPAVAGAIVVLGLFVVVRYLRTARSRRAGVVAASAARPTAKPPALLPKATPAAHAAAAARRRNSCADRAGEIPREPTPDELLARLRRTSARLEQMVTELQGTE